MNKRNCEDIGWILSKYAFPEFMLDEFFALDERIRDDYELFSDGQRKKEATSDRFEKLMEEKLGHNWCLLKAAKEHGHELWKQAESEINEEWPD